MDGNLEDEIWGETGSSLVLLISEIELRPVCLHVFPLNKSEAVVEGKLSLSVFFAPFFRRRDVEDRRNLGNLGTSEI